MGMRIIEIWKVDAKAGGRMQTDATGLQAVLHFIRTNLDEKMVRDFLKEFPAPEDKYLDMDALIRKLVSRKERIKVEVERDETADYLVAMLACLG